jgi:transcription initiation factor TFIID subunit 2
MTIRIHEADGTPYEHVLDIRQPFKRFEVPFNTKYKRVRRNTKRYMARQAAAQAAVDGEEPPTTGPVPGELVDVGFAVEIWDNERERDNWKISEWSEEDDARMASATYEWIRLDVDLEWITAIAFEQPDYMWVSQLQRDRDVVAQLEAVQALKRQPTAIISSVLVKTVLVSKYFHRIRCEAALALASVSRNWCFEVASLNTSQCAIPKLDYLGLFHLFKLFLRHCFEPEDPRQDLFTHTYVPRTNDFTDLAEYFVRKVSLLFFSYNMPLLTVEIVTGQCLVACSLR